MTISSLLFDRQNASEKPVGRRNAISGKLGLQVETRSPGNRWITTRILPVTGRKGSKS